MRPGPVVVAVALALGSTGGLAACSDGDVNDGGVYCAALIAAEPTLNTEIVAELDIAARIELYEQLHDQAPLAVEDEWEQVIDLLRAAATVDLADSTAVSAVADQAISTTRAAQAIVDHAATLCGVTLPAVGQLPPAAATISIPTTTLPESPPSS